MSSPGLRNNLYVQGDIKEPRVARVKWAGEEKPGDMTLSRTHTLTLSEMELGPEG